MTLELTDDASSNATEANATSTSATAVAGQTVVCAGYSLEVANHFGVITDRFNLEVLDAQQNRYVAQGSLFDTRSQKLLARIAQANGGLGWTVQVANGVILE